ncbi:enoyl-CoA hydratase/isomerase family protein [Endozoicomonadaceae bacterium StTr2]
MSVQLKSDNCWVSIDRVDDVAIVYLDRKDGRRNALNDKFHQEIGDAWHRLGKDETLRAVVVTGKCGWFCAGGDLDWLSAEHSPDNVPLIKATLAFTRNLTGLKKLHVPVIAAINGGAVGAGFSLALACDMRITSADSIFCTRMMDVGLGPGVGLLQAMNGMIGSARSFELMALAEEFSGQKALDLGLVNAVVEPDQVLNKAIEIAQRLAAKPAIAMVPFINTFRALNAGQSDLSHVAEAYQQCLSYYSDEYFDAIENVRNTKVKRAAVK